MKVHWKSPTEVVKAIRLGIVALAALEVGCGGQSPLAPAEGSKPSVAELVTVSGQVYVDATWGEPPIRDASITVTRDGEESIVSTNRGGFYRISVKSGSLSITASKEGYESKAWSLVLSNDTVLNFSLTPK